MCDTDGPAVRLEVSDGAIVLRLVGVINLCVAADLHAAALRALDAGGPIIVDWAAADYLDVSALQVLIALRRALEAEGRRAWARGTPDWLPRHLALVGLAEFVPESGSTAMGMRRSE